MQACEKAKITKSPFKPAKCTTMPDKVIIICSFRTALLLSCDHLTYSLGLKLDGL